MDHEGSDRPLSENSPNRSADPNDETLDFSSPLPAFPQTKPPPRKKRFTITLRWVDLVALTVLLAVAAAIGVISFRKHSKSAPAPAPGKIRLAVLPFENLTGDPKQDYVGDGFAEEMISQLGRMNHDRLGVIARTSVMRYKNTRKPVRKIASELGVNYVLEGSVRKSPDGFRIATQLVRAEDEIQLWSEEYDRPMDDLTQLERDVALKVADEIQVQLMPGSPADIRAPHDVNSNAYFYYLQGRYFFSMRSGENLFDAVSSFDQAIRQDPGFAPAYAGLADTYNMLMYYGYSPEKETLLKARTAAIKATELDGALAEGHASLAYIYFLWDWNWQDAEREFQRAISLNDNYAPAHHWYALYLTAMGRQADSLSQIEQAHELDPLSSIVTSASAYIDYFAGQNDHAVTQCESVLQQDPKFMAAHTVLGLAREAQGNYATAIAEFQKALRFSASRPPAYLDNLGHAYAVSGHRAKAEQILSELEAGVKSGKQTESYTVATLVGLGERDRALAAMEKSFAKGDLALIWLKVDPRFDDLRASPRFQALLQRGGFIP
jgi:TolB-like protein/Tfp pilus assembly protein PilF